MPKIHKLLKIWKLAGSSELKFMCFYFRCGICLLGGCLAGNDLDMLVLYGPILLGN